VTFGRRPHPTARRRRRGFGLCIGSLLVGCSGTVTPAPAPPHPTTIYVCDYGYHSSLLLPVGDDGTFVEYLYGDWDWAVLNHTGALAAIHAGLFSPAATLGRRYVYAPLHAVPRPVTMPVTQVALVVDGDACQRLQRSLDARWRAHADTAVYTGPAGSFYLFVRDAEPYGLLHNCNRLTADCLDQLGCTTGGLPLLSHFTVETRR
jgi:hypothetical protein